MMPFSDIHISQGSLVTCLKRDGIFKHELVANLLPSPLVKKIENRIIVGEVMAKSLVSCFLTHGVHYNVETKFTTVYFKFSSLAVTCGFRADR